MLYLKKISKALIYTFSILLISIILVTLISYVSEGIIYKTLKLLLPILSLFIGGIIIGKNSKNKGWLEGLKYSGIVIIILILVSFILPNNSFDIKRILYYLVLIFIGTIGSMLGINKTIDKK